MELTTVWFCLIAVLWVGYFVLEGFDFGVGMLLPDPGPGRARTPRPDQHDRAGLGRQRGLAAGRGRRDVRSLPRVVRDPVQRLLPAAAGHPARVDRPRGRVRVPAQATRSALAQPLGRGDLRRVGRPGPAVGSRLRQHRARCRRSTPTRSTSAACSTCSTPTHCSAASPRSGSVPHPRRDVRGAEDRRRHPAPGQPARVSGSGSSPRSSPSRSWSGHRLQHGSPGSLVLFAVAAVALVLGLVAALRGREGWGFLGTFVCIGAAVFGLFAALFPDVMPSTLDPAYSLTTTNASATHYTLQIMTVVALVFTPLVLLYQAWTYWVFRRRISTHHIPESGEPQRASSAS